MSKTYSGKVSDIIDEGNFTDSVEIKRELIEKLAEIGLDVCYQQNNQILNRSRYLKF